jgi:integrase
MRVLTEDEEMRLYAELADHIKPIVTIALNTGLRLGEIMKLKWSDVDLSKQLLKVENTKSGKVRYVPINASVVTYLRDGQGKLFKINNPKQGFRAACRRSRVQALRFHDLRHTFATRSLQGGADIETVRQILGHSSLSVTQKYVHSGLDQMRQAVESLPILSHICPAQKSNILNMPSKLVN